MSDLMASQMHINSLNSNPGLKTSNTGLKSLNLGLKLKVHIYSSNRVSTFEE